MKILCVEEGSVDIDAIENEGLSDGKVLVYKQGSNPPFVLEISEEPRAIVELKKLQRLFEEDSCGNSYGSACATSQTYYDLVTKIIEELENQHEDKGE